MYLLNGHMSTRVVSMEDFLLRYRGYLQPKLVICISYSCIRSIYIY
jgi:hypothetical protein